MNIRTEKKIAKKGKKIEQSEGKVILAAQWGISPAIGAERAKREIKEKLRGQNPDLTGKVRPKPGYNGESGAKTLSRIN